MSNIYLKVSIETFIRLRFYGFKKFVTRLVLWSSNHVDIAEFSNFLLQLKNQRLGSKILCGFCIILILKGIRTF